MTIGGFKGSDPLLADNLQQFNGQMFSAHQTKADSIGCVFTNGGGWWYVPERCVAPEGQTQGSVLTKPYFRLNYYEPNEGVKLTFAKYEMKIRPVNCVPPKESTT